MITVKKLKKRSVVKIQSIQGKSLSQIKELDNHLHLAEAKLREIKRNYRFISIIEKTNKSLAETFSRSHFYSDDISILLMILIEVPLVVLVLCLLEALLILPIHLHLFCFY